MTSERLADGSEGAGELGGERRQVRVARPSLVSLMVEAGVGSEEALLGAAEEAHQKGLRLGEFVLGRGWLDEEDMAQLLACQWSLPYLARESLAIDPVAAGLLPYEHAVAFGGCVIGIRDGGPLAVVADPSTERLNRLRAHLQAILVAATPSFAIVTGSSLERLLAQLSRIHQSEPASDQIPCATEAATAEPETSPLPQEAASGQPDTTRLGSDLQPETAALTALRDQLAHLTSDHDLAQQELTRLRQQLDAIQQLRVRDQEEIRELQTRLHAQHSQYSALKRRLTELLAELGAASSREIAGGAAG